MGRHRIERLRNTPRAVLIRELKFRLEAALCNVSDQEKATDLVLQLLIIRIDNQHVLLQPDKWMQTIQLWYKLIDKYPKLGDILSEYDEDFQLRQNLLVNAVYDSKETAL
ncbi:hypothetical protein GF391_02630 [Candidatus Uhrbacteria bacterium]|nr:hypothetical protein [Candidatus Uhrbacteria bacterium]